MLIVEHWYRSLLRSKSPSCIATAMEISHFQNVSNTTDVEKDWTIVFVYYSLTGLIGVGFGILAATYALTK